MVVSLFRPVAVMRAFAETVSAPGEGWRPGGGGEEALWHLVFIGFIAQAECAARCAPAVMDTDAKRAWSPGLRGGSLMRQEGWHPHENRQVFVGEFYKWYLPGCNLRFSAADCNGGG